MLGGISIYRVAFIIINLTAEEYLRAYCYWESKVSVITFISGFIDSAGLLIQLGAHIYFSVTLCTRHIRLKYKIKPELLIQSLSWIVFIVTGILFRFSTGFPQTLIQYFMQPLSYVVYAIELVMCTFLIPYPLWANRNEQIEQDISSLIQEFP